MTETGDSVSSGGVLNTATSGTRVKIIFNNIPANVAVYIPIAATNKTGSVALTASEAGPFSAVPELTGTGAPDGTAALAVVNESATAVYEVTADSIMEIENYYIPVYLAAAAGTAPVQAGAMTATVSFAPIGATGNLPNFVNAITTTMVSGSMFSACGSTISFGALSDQVVVSGPVTLTATGTSGVPVTFASNTPAVCSVSANTVAILASGGCSITASQAGDANYAPAPPVAQSFTVLFNDVAPTDYDYAAINTMAQHGITAGCGNNGFCPNDNVTRDEMAIFIVRAIYGNDNLTYPTTPYFTDVTSTTFGFKWIQKLKDLGITAGCTATTYCPTEVVTRDQVAIFIIRARLGLALAGSTPTFSYPSTPYFTDATADNEFAFPWIQRMKTDSITAGCTATAYCPTDPVTRGEMAIFIMRGAFNQFLPAGTPMISSISPGGLPVGTSVTFTVTGVNTNFVQGTTVISPIPGVTIGAVTVTSATSLTVQLSAASNAVAQPYSILAITGSEQDVLPNGLLLQ